VGAIRRFDLRSRRTNVLCCAALCAFAHGNCGFKALVYAVGSNPPYARPACGLPPPINSHDIGKRRATAEEDGHDRFAVVLAASPSVSSPLAASSIDDL
jgi:hypothetical protein